MVTAYDYDVLTAGILQAKQEIKILLLGLIIGCARVEDVTCNNQGIYIGVNDGVF